MVSHGHKFRPTSCHEKDEQLAFSPPWRRSNSPGPGRFSSELAMALWMWNGKRISRMVPLQWSFPVGIGRSWKFLEPMEPIQSWGEFQDLSTNTGAISIRISTGWTLASLLLKNPKTGMRGQSFLHQINLAIWNRNWCVIPFCGTSSPSACMTLCVPSCRFQCGMTHWNLVGSDKKWFCLTIGHPKNHRWIIIFPIKLLLQKSQKWEGFQLLKNWPVSILPQTRKKNHPWSATIWHLQPVVMIVSTTLYYTLRRTSQICSKMGTSGATQTGHGLDCNLKHPLGGQYDKQVPEYAHDKHVLSCSSRCYGWFSPHNFQVSNLARVPKKNPMSSYSLYGLCFYQQTPTINPRRTPPSVD